MIDLLIPPQADGAPTRWGSQHQGHPAGTITPPDVEYGYGRVDAFRAILSLARGDMNASGTVNLADITILISQVYNNGAEGFPDIRLGNCDCDPEGKINLADINLLIDHVYLSKDPLPLPCFVY